MAKNQRPGGRKGKKGAGVSPYKVEYMLNRKGKPAGKRPRKGKYRGEPVAGTSQEPVRR